MERILLKYHFQKIIKNNNFRYLALPTDALALPTVALAVPTLSS